MLGDHTTNYQLHLTQVIDIGPGEPAQPVHRDQWAFDFFEFPPGFEVECHTMWAMTDFTEENGATRVIPGQQHWDDSCGRTASDTVAAEMPQGLGAAVHRLAVPRRRREPFDARQRRGINVGYTLSWLRQEENQYLACPPEVARELPIELAEARRLPAGRVRARLLRRPPGSDRSVARRRLGSAGFATK